ncbi:MAG: cytochrome c oxidase accessory protein CcoG [Verrucomicrobiota bacterium]|nr:cytochrome c oxidase accessory protein CcoG [Verrucomicrobiota bacterium]
MPTLQEPDDQTVNPGQSVSQPIAWEDFRDHLATAEKDGRRKWVYPKKVTGKWYRYRTYMSWLLLGLMFIGPFITIGGNPLLMMNLIERRFSILGQIFWPQDMVIFAVAMLLFLMGIIIFTSAFGRLWCGWACPQTVLMEMVFRKIEYLIEGDAASRRALDAAKWDRPKILRKGFKHLLFLGLSFAIGNWLLSYIIGLESLLEIVVDDPRNHLVGLGFMLVFTAIFYLIFARFREQACTFICPYGRFQSAILDENSMVVAYDHKRGEKRGPLKRKSAGSGDCVDCFQCVAVCPTGIDIRNGTQMECVNCTACIDACDAVMAKLNLPPGLVRYASLNSIDRKERFRFTARMACYAAVLAALSVLFIFLLFTRTGTETAFLRAPGALFQELPGDKISNLYTVKTINKTNRDLPLEFKLLNLEGNLRVMGDTHFTVAKGSLAQTSVLVEIEKRFLLPGKTKLEIEVISANEKLETVRTVFVGPRN